MEHRLITGGYEYLPFARSCITKLKKLGLPYASQSFEIGGASIKVRIEPGHEYIRIEGGGVNLLMDSGVIDLKMPYMTPYEPGVLHRTDNNAAYDNGFTKYSIRKNKFTGVEEVWKLNPSKYSSGQMSGDVAYSSTFKGAVPPDALEARSFAVAREQVASEQPDSATPWTPVLIDDLLKKKKLTAEICPASTFTGKCRLYIQAMYGQHLYDYTRIKNGAPEALYVPEVVDPKNSGASPHLLVDSYVAPNDTKEDGSLNYYPQVTVSTNSGVYLDKKTGKHWLVNFNGDGKSMIFTPLIGKSESLRKFLKTDPPKTSAEPLTDIDREHLEAYVLATCLPDSKNRITVAVENLPHSYSLGYGWHWNWTGDKADIVNIGAKVKNEGVSWTNTTVGEYYVQTSAHYRLTIKPTTSEDPDTKKMVTTWEAALTTVTPTIEWNVYRSFWTILEPNWLEGGFVKTTLPFEAVRGMIVDAVAPIYAFYKRDTLHLATLNIITSYPSADEVTYSNEALRFSSAADVALIDVWSYGTNSEFVEKIGGASNNVDGGRIVSVTFSCGSYTAPATVYNRSKSGWRTDASEKVITGWRDNGTVTVSGGLLGYVAPPEVPIAPTIAASGTMVGMSYNITTSSVAQYESCSLRCVVPRGDSEAMFVRAQQVLLRTVTPDSEIDMSSIGFATWSRQFDVELVLANPPCTYGYTYTDPGASDDDLVFRNAMTYTHPGTTSVDTEIGAATDTSEVTASDRNLIAGGKSTEVLFDEMAEAQDDTVEVITAYTFKALSGTSVVTPTILAPGRAAPIGVQAEPPSAALVGWI